MLKDHKKLLGIFLIFSSIIGFVFTQPVFAGAIRHDDFNQAGSLNDWKEKKYRGHVEYLIQLDGSNGYVYSYGKKSATGRFVEVSYDPNDYPVLRWKWKVDKFPDRHEKTPISDDSDFGARVYVIFPAFIFINSHCIEYVFDESLKEGTVIKSTLSKNVQLIVIRAGKDNLGKWFNEERDIVQDYLQLFGKKPPKVGAVAIMTDSDHTESESSADYDDFFIGVNK